MTPRSVSGYNSSNDFARQLAEHKRELSGQPPTKKFKSSAAPKGTKLAQGYQDRTSLRRAEGEDAETQDDKEKRLKALEEMMKLQQIDESTFEKLRDEIGVGGDVSSTHLVKGLDWKLLKRVKEGEDITSNLATAETGLPEQPDVDVDGELEDALAKEVQAVQKEEKSKAGEMAPPPPTGSLDGRKLSRNEILQRLKAGRVSQGHQEPPPLSEPALGGRFKKVGSGDNSEKKRFTETVNGRRREVLITIDKDGRTKRKTRWLDKETTGVVDPSTISFVQQPLGMEVPAELAAKQRLLLEKRQQEEDDDDYIFAGVGADYNPLADINDASGDEARIDGEVESPGAGATEAEVKTEDSKPKPRSYFTTNGTEESHDKSNPFSSDPSIMAALKRAAELRTSANDAGNESSTTEPEDHDPERMLKRKQFLETLRKRDREDAQDMDYGFGESRFDEDDEDGPIFEDGEEGGKKSGRKRGPRKRKGDKNSVDDLMHVLAGRNQAGLK